MTDSVLLDTCAWIWVAQGHERLTKKSIKFLERHRWMVSAISVWELAMLATKGRIKLKDDLSTWVQQALVLHPNITLVPLTPSISINSCQLTIEHKDPADRMIVATAKEKKVTLVTGDQKLIDYGEQEGFDIYPV